MRAISYRIGTNGRYEGWQVSYKPRYGNNFSFTLDFLCIILKYSHIKKRLCIPKLRMINISLGTLLIRPEVLTWIQLLTTVTDYHSVWVMILQTHTNTHTFKWAMTMPLLLFEVVLLPTRHLSLYCEGWDIHPTFWPVLYKCKPS